MAYAMLVPVVIFFALPLVAISAFAALAVADRQRDLPLVLGLALRITCATPSGDRVLP